MATGMRQQKVSARRGHKQIARWDMRAEEPVRAYSKHMVDAVVQVVLSPLRVARGACGWRAARESQLRGR